VIECKRVGLVRGTRGCEELPGNDEPEVALNRILHALYRRTHFDLRLDYTQPPVPPLAWADASWAQELITTHGLGQCGSLVERSTPAGTPTMCPGQLRSELLSIGQKQVTFFLWSHVKAFASAS